MGATSDLSWLDDPGVRHCADDRRPLRFCGDQLSVSGHCGAVGRAIAGADVWRRIRALQTAGAMADRPLRVLKVLTFRGKTAKVAKAAKICFLCGLGALCGDRSVAPTG